MYTFKKISNLKTGELTQQLGALDVLRKEPGLVPSTPMVAHNGLSLQSLVTEHPLSLPQAQACTWCVNIYMQELRYVHKTEIEEPLLYSNIM